MHPRARLHLARYVAATGAAVALLLAPAFPGSSAGAAVPRCKRAGSQFEPGSLARIRWKTKCLIDRTRVRRGLSRLRHSRALRRSAKAHGLDMVRRAYFSHSSPDRSSLTTRIARSGYLSSARGWAVGENLGCVPEAGRPGLSVFRAWMRSPAHRRLILNPVYSEVGLSIVRGAPAPYRGRALTFVLHVGRRR
jgi:uncharacterized protein YkwD